MRRTAPANSTPEVRLATETLPSWIAELEAFAGASLPNIRLAAQRALDKRREISDALSQSGGLPLIPADASFVAYGSLARAEWTEDSDVDWTLLIDGPVVSHHVAGARGIADRLRTIGCKDPGREGVFGRLTFSHDLVHRIGGQNDTNANMTQRILLLLESIVLDDPQAYERVYRAVLGRYCEEDVHFPAPDPSHYKVPRFLLNDIVRFWRTMAVDYTSKRYERANEGWALRYAKLRMSRKLIYAAGLWSCLTCALEPAPRATATLFRQPESIPLLDFLISRPRRTPLDTLSHAVRMVGTPELAGDLFTSYDRFLAILADPEKRERLAKLPLAGAEGDPLLVDARTLSLTFQKGLGDLLFRGDARLAALVEEYGVF
jgi:hypothetical protein